jgi:hypothetical protein
MSTTHLSSPDGLEQVLLWNLSNEHQDLPGMSPFFLYKRMKLIYQGYGLPG